MKKEQLFKLLSVAMIMTSMMVVFEGIFSIPGVTKFFSDAISKTNGTLVYLVIWTIMFLQTTILNVPAYVILSACVGVGINTLNFVYVMIVISAYMCGCVVSYWFGRKFGIKAVKWCAGDEEEYDKWSNILNQKGRWIYLLTVIFPLFPDDLLCIVAGAVKLNFVFYTIANLIGRTIGLITMLLTLNSITAVGGDFPLMLLVWSIALIVEFVLYLILRRRLRNESDCNRG